MPRFTDDKLQEFYSEFEDHRDEFERHREEQRELHNQLLYGINENTRTVADLAGRVATISQEVKDVIETWAKYRGFVSVVRWFGDLIKWIVSVATAVAVIVLYFK